MTASSDLAVNAKRGGIAAQFDSGQIARLRGAFDAAKTNYLANVTTREPHRAETRLGKRKRLDDLFPKSRKAQTIQHVRVLNLLLRDDLNADTSMTCLPVILSDTDRFDPKNNDFRSVKEKGREGLPIRNAFDDLAELANLSAKDGKIRSALYPVNGGHHEGTLIEGATGDLTDAPFICHTEALMILPGKKVVIPEWSLTEMHTENTVTGKPGEKINGNIGPQKDTKNESINTITAVLREKNLKVFTSNIYAFLLDEKDKKRTLDSRGKGHPYMLSPQTTSEDCTAIAGAILRSELSNHAEAAIKHGLFYQPHGSPTGLYIPPPTDLTHSQSSRYNKTWQLVIEAKAEQVAVPMKKVGDGPEALHYETLESKFQNNAGTFTRFDGTEIKTVAELNKWRKDWLTGYKDMEGEREKTNATIDVSPNNTPIKVNIAWRADYAGLDGALAEAKKIIAEDHS